MRGTFEVGVQHAQPADERRHLGRRQREELRAVHQEFLGRKPAAPVPVVAEPVRGRFEYGERVCVRLLLRCIGASRREGDRDVVARVLRGLLDGRAGAEDDQVGERHALGASGLGVERPLDVHGHAGGGLADVAAGGDRVRPAVRPLRVDVDQAHLDGAQRVLGWTGRSAGAARPAATGGATSPRWRRRAARRCCRSRRSPGIGSRSCSSPWRVPSLACRGQPRSGHCSCTTIIYYGINRILR